MQFRSKLEKYYDEYKRQTPTNSATYINWKISFLRKLIDKSEAEHDRMVDILAHNYQECGFCPIKNASHYGNCPSKNFR